MASTVKELLTEWGLDRLEQTFLVSLALVLILIDGASIMIQLMLNIFFVIQLELQSSYGRNEVPLQCLDVLPDGDNDIDCEDYHDEANQSMKCEFISSTNDCNITDGFVNYLQWAYCNFSKTQLPFAMMLLILWLFYLFISLAMTAENFFCPALGAISRALKLSESTAGVTLLALGNGAPDIISAVSASRAGKTDLIIGELFGAGTFITTVVTATVMVRKPFKLEEVPFLRDVILNLFVVFWIFTIFWRTKSCTPVTLTESIGFVLFYIGYVIIVFVGRRVGIMCQQRGRPMVTAVRVDDDNENERQRFAESMDLSHNFQDDEFFEILSDENDDGRCGDFKRFLQNINPIRFKEWQYTTIPSNLLQVLKAPIQLALKITIPIVDYDARKHGWNRPLNVLQIITGPLIALLSFAGALVEIGRIYLWHLLLLICCFVALFVFCTSNSHEPPIYHFVFACLAFVVSVTWIHLIVNEIINLLLMLGIEMGLSTAILGLTLLAWGNCIGDLVSNITVARRGCPRMAFAACYGGPLCNMLLGIGISSIITATRNGGSFLLDDDLLHFVLVVGILTSLLSSMFVMLCTQFNTSRFHAVYLYGLYLCFLVIAILTELGYIDY